MTIISVIGGSGFIGTRLCQRLARSNKRFQILDKAPSSLFLSEGVLADVRSLDSLRGQISEGAILINLAAEHRDDVRPVSLYEDVNVGARAIFAMLRGRKILKLSYSLVQSLCMALRQLVLMSRVLLHHLMIMGGQSMRLSKCFDYGRSRQQQSVRW